MGEIEALVVLLANMGFPLWSIALIVAVVVILKMGLVGVVKAINQFSERVAEVVQCNTKEQIQAQKSNQKIIEVMQQHAVDTKEGMDKIDNKVMKLISLYGSLSENPE